MRPVEKRHSHTRPSLRRLGAKFSFESLFGRKTLPAGDTAAALPGLIPDKPPGNINKSSRNQKRKKMNTNYGAEIMMRGNEMTFKTANADQLTTKRSLVMKKKKIDRMRIPRAGALWRLLVAFPAALMLALAQVAPAWATIDNTVTVTGSSPSGTNDVTDNATENVDVVDAAPALTVTKVADTAGPVAAGTTITYTFTATNSGNQTLTAVSMADPHDAGAANSLSTISFVASPLTDVAPLLDSTDGGGDDVWDTLAPGDTITWQATYVVAVADISTQVGGDGTIDNTATGSALDPLSAAVNDSSLAVSIPVDAANASLLMAKVADDTTDVILGQLITYTYTITNNGNVPITAISLGDVHNGSGPAPAPDADAATLTDNGTPGDSTNPSGGDGQWDTLAPGDVLTVTATYTVTQSDIDNLQ